MCHCFILICCLQFEQVKAMRRGRSRDVLAVYNSNAKV
jgi:hypothetical protein